MGTIALRPLWDSFVAAPGAVAEQEQQKKPNVVLMKTRLHEAYPYLAKVTASQTPILPQKLLHSFLRILNSERTGMSMSGARAIGMIEPVG